MIQAPVLVEISVSMGGDLTSHDQSDEHTSQQKEPSIERNEVMTWIRLRLSLGATVCAVVYIIGGIFGPTIAFACEGAGEEAEAQNISIKPIESGTAEVASGTKTCPENGEKKVEFNALTEWCEYKVINGNKAEEVEVRSYQGNRPVGEECWTVGCLALRVTVNKPECPAGTKLVAKGGSCWFALQYSNEPAVERTTGFDVITESKPGKALAKPEVFQVIK